MLEEIKLRNFEISFAIEKDLQIEQFSFGNELADLLNKELKLENYSQSIKCLFVIFQCFDPENKFVQTKERYSYRRKNQAIEVYLNLDYTEVKKANKKELIQILLNTYFVGIEKLLKRKEFDVAALIRDIKVLF